MNQNRNSGIQWMRAVAAFLVVIDHCLFTLMEKAGADPSIGPLAAFLGGTGVKIFFLISGFVMIVSSTHDFGPSASGAFIKRRLIRIASLYWITTGIYTVKLWLAGEPASWVNFFNSLFFIPYMNAHGEMQPIYGLGWTLNYETFFYLIFAVGLLHSLRVTMIFVGATLGVLSLFGAMLSAGDDGALSFLLYFWSRPIILFFLAGMTLPYLAEQLRARIGVWPLAFSQTALISVLLVALAFGAGYTYGLSTPLQLILLSVPVLVVAMVGGADGRFARLASTLGDASYSIYLTHSFVIGPLARVYGTLGLQAPVVFVGLSLIVCSCLGVLCFKYVEKPLIRWLSATMNRAPKLRVVN